MGLLLCWQASRVIPGTCQDDDYHGRMCRTSDLWSVTRSEHEHVHNCILQLHWTREFSNDSTIRIYGRVPPRNDGQHFLH